MKLQIALILFIILQTKPAFAVPEQVKKLIFRTFDADTNAQVEANILIDGAPITDNSYIIPDNADNRVVIEVIADREKDYLHRQFKVSMEGLNESTVFYYIYLAKANTRNSTYTLGTIRTINALPIIDRKVVLLERVREALPPPLTEVQSGVELLYNLANAYMSNCIKRFVDQCEEARTIFSRLVESYQREETIFQRAKITVDDMLKKNKDIDSHYIRMKHLSGRWDLSHGRCEIALTTFNELLTKAREDNSVLKDIDRSMQGLESDRDFAASLLEKNCSN